VACAVTVKKWETFPISIILGASDEIPGGVLTICFTALATLSKMFISVYFLQQGSIVMQVAGTCMEAQYAHKEILIIAQVGHSLDIFDMGMLVKVKT
jgi:hypothetical protein